MLSESIKVIKDYFTFRKNSKPRGGHGIHSPFVYELYTTSIDNDKKETIFESIEKIRKELKRSKVLVNRISLGASSTSDLKCSVGDISKKASIPPYLGRLLYRLAKYQRPSSIIELGTSLGLSTMYLAAANKETFVYSIEGDPSLSKIAADNLNKVGATNVFLINGRFDDELPSLLSKLDKIDMVFVDGNHTEEATMRYFSLLLEKVDENSMIIFDDIRWSEGMQNAWKNICDSKNVSISIDLFRCGIVFFRKGVIKQHFNLRFGPF